MIKLTMKEVVNAAPVLAKLTNQSFSGIATFKIARLLKAFDEEVSLFEETRAKLIQKYCKKDENGNLIQENNQLQVEPDKIEAFNEELNALLSTVVELKGEKLQIDYFENIALTPIEASVIEMFIE